MVRFYKWFKTPVMGTRVEVTKDYFAEGDEYINRDNGWVRIEEHCIDVKVGEKDGN